MSILSESEKPVSNSGCNGFNGVPANSAGADVGVNGVVSNLKDIDEEAGDRFPAISLDFMVTTYVLSIVRFPVKPTDAAAAFRPNESDPLKYKNTESVGSTFWTVNVGVLSFVRSSSFLIPVSDASSKSMLIPVTTGAVWSTSISILVELTALLETVSLTLLFSSLNKK